MGVYKIMKRLLVGCLFIVSSLSGQEIYATFDVHAEQSAKVAFSSSGIVGKISANIGSIVKKDEVLAKLKNEDTKAMLNIYKTSLKYAKKDYERQVKVKNIIDKAKFDSFANKYESSKAQVTYQQELLNKTILKAPFDGLIISKEIESGDVVSGQMIKTAFQIQSISERKLVLQFDQQYNKIVKVGDTFSYKLDGDDKQYSGTISKIYPYANTSTRKISAEVLTNDILVGLFGDGYITSSK